MSSTQRREITGGEVQIRFDTGLVSGLKPHLHEQFDLEQFTCKIFR